MQGQLDQFIDALGGFRDDPDARRDFLDHAGQALLHRPALGGQLVARFCATAEKDPALEDLNDLLAMALDSARMARENRQKRGDAFLAGIEEAVDLATRRGTLGGVHRLLLAQIWARTGLTPPSALELHPEDDDGAPTADPAEIDAMLDDLIGHVIRETGGDALAAHATLAETFPAMPAEMRSYLVRFAVARPDPVHARLGCLWLLDPAPEIRLAAAAGLGERPLTTEITARLVVLRSWMPEDAARARLDRILRDAMREAVGPAAPTAPWTVHSILATLPDGGGAQSFGIALQSGKRRSVAMLLLKQEQGVKDAYVVPCRSASDQKALMKRLVDETGALKVPPGYLEQALAVALGEHLPPAPGLIDIATLCGLTGLRPQPSDTRALLAGLAGHDRVAAMSVQKRGRLINDSEDWWHDHPIVQSWFEESDSAHEHLQKNERALWRWLETRRDWWAHLVARGAAMLEAAGHPDAMSFTATAMALLNGRDLKKIPVMRDVYEESVEVWEFDGPDGAPAEMADMPEAPAPPRPEGKGELAKLLKGTARTPDWIDGFLMSVAVAPKLVAPSRWLPEILDAGLDPTRLQRYLDLVMMRANAAVSQADDSAEFGRRMQGREPRDWAAGFSHGCETFRASWPAKSTGPDDRAMLKLIAGAATSGLADAELRTLGLWLQARYRRNQARA